MTYQGLFNHNDFYSGIDTYLSVLHLAFPPEKKGMDEAGSAPLLLHHSSWLSSPVVPPSGGGSTRDPHPLTLPLPLPSHLWSSKTQQNYWFSFLSRLVTKSHQMMRHRLLELQAAKFN